MKLIIEENDRKVVVESNDKDLTGEEMSDLVKSALLAWGYQLETVKQMFNEKD